MNKDIASKLNLSIRTVERLIGKAESRSITHLLKKNGRELERMTREMKLLRLAYSDYLDVKGRDSNDSYQSRVSGLTFRFKRLSIQVECELEKSKGSLRKVKTHRRAFTKGYFSGAMHQRGHLFDKTR